MKLVYTKGRNAGKLVKIGDTVTIKDDGKWVVKHFHQPHSPASEGKVYVQPQHQTGNIAGREYYVSVIGAEWIEREDRETQWQVTITVANQAQTKKILRALGLAEDDGKIDFPFNTEVREVLQ